MKRRLIAAALLCALLAGCAGAQPVQDPPDASQSAAEESPAAPLADEAALPADAPLPAEPMSAAPERRGSGSIAYDGAQSRLTEEQESLLLEYMDLYYQSLAYLEAADPAALFVDAESAAAKQAAWAVTAAIRAGSQSDLSLTGFSYELTLISISEDGEVSVTASEYAVQNFAAFPGVDSESFNVVHRFVLTETGAGWKIRSHSQVDTASRLAGGGAVRPSPSSGSGGSGSGNSSNSSSSRSTAERQADLLESHARNRAARAAQAADYDPDAVPALRWDHDYDRAAAVAYANRWVGARNTADWPSYDRNGGNCQNYTSQCVLAGGIPMDIHGSQWKWYGVNPNTANAASGRSASWSGVNEFYTYARSNSGYGMVAEPDANFWTGQPGDLIQLGYEDTWRHVVIITEVVCDEAGMPVDYLIASNTADLRGYPVSAYAYPQQRLIRILGWNAS